MRRLSLLSAAFLLTGATLFAHDSSHRGNRSISFDDDDNAPANCSSLRVKFDGDRVPVVTENVPVGNVRSLRVRSEMHGGIRVVGDASGGYSVTACKASGLNGDVSRIRVSVKGNEVSATGPDDDDWIVYFIVRAPRNATLDVSSSNGPVGVYDFDGTLTARATNGPVGLKDSRGTIDASTVNGPISIEGGSGNVKLNATNGPVAVTLDGSSWQGGNLDASTENGPVSLSLPRGYRSGVIVESRGHGPVSCRAEGCLEARRRAITNDNDDYDNRPRRLELGSGATAVRLSTVNGPISVKDR